MGWKFWKKKDSLIDTGMTDKSMPPFDPSQPAGTGLPPMEDPLAGEMPHRIDKSGHDLLDNPLPGTDSTPPWQKQQPSSFDSQSSFEHQPPHSGSNMSPPDYTKEFDKVTDKTTSEKNFQILNS
ncbi:hypothetical protein JW868_03195, partial [Candidatus Woesearchaeota archaeon]|nr:hypothetical protein [Candidatus Woesearchaeota archaeon]